MTLDYTLTCPHCGKLNATAGHILGHSKTPAKGVAARENGKRGGRPKNKTTTKENTENENRNTAAD